MAASNSLELLFSVGVDTADARAALSQLSDSQKQFIAGVLDGMIKTSQQVLATIKTLGAEERQVFEGIIEEAQKAQQVLKEVGSAHEKTTIITKEHARAVAELRRIFQDLKEGDFGAAISGIGKALASGNPLLIAMVGAAIAAGLAILALKKGIEEYADAVEKAATDSKDDFKALQESIAAVGGTLTLADHALAQGIQKSFENLKASVTDFFLNVMKPSGPALITLLTDLSKLIEGMIPFAEKLGLVLKEAFISIIATLRTLQILKDLGVGALLLTPAEILGLMGKVADQARKEIDALGASLKNQTGTFKDTAKAGEDFIETSLNARLRLTAETLEREKQIYDTTIRDITLLYRAGAIDRVQAGEIEAFALKRYTTAINKSTDDRLALEKQLEEHQKKRALTAEESAAFDQKAANQRYEDQLKINKATTQGSDELDKADAAQRKHNEERLKQLDEIIARTEKLGLIIRNQAREPGGVPGQPDFTGADRGLPTIPGVKSVSDAIKDLPKPDLSVWQEWGKGTTDALGQVADSFGGVKGIIAGGLEHISGALQDSIAGWILYGKFSGKALKQAAAEAIAGMAAQAIVAAIFETAAGLASLAWGDPAGAAKHFTAAEVYGTVGAVAAIAGAAIGAAGGLLGSQGQAAAGGGFNGSSATPNDATSPVNINLGGSAASQLGLSLQVAQLDALNSLNSKLSMASPGDVVTRAAETTPEAFAQGTLNAGRRNGGFTREFMQISGAHA